MSEFLALNIWEYGVYLSIAVIATFIAAIITLLSFFGIGFDDVDFAPGDASGDFGYFSLRSIIGFFLGFGWGGVIAENMGYGWEMCLIIAILVGIGMFVIMAILIKMMTRLKSDTNLQYDSLVGMTASVYVTMPPKGQSGGQVKVAHPTQLYYLPAIQHGEEALPVGTMVRITEAGTDMLTVEKI